TARRRRGRATCRALGDPDSTTRRLRADRLGDGRRAIGRGVLLEGGSVGVTGAVAAVAAAGLLRDRRPVGRDDPPHVAEVRVALPARVAGHLAAGVVVER